MLKFIEKEIDNLIKSENLESVVSKVDEIGFSFLMERISNEFNIKIYEEIWTQLIENEPVLILQDNMGWEKVAYYIDFPCHIIIKNSTDEISYLIKDSSALLKILKESTGFVFYLYANKRIVFFNDYDTLGVFDSASRSLHET